MRYLALDELLELHRLALVFLKLAAGTFGREEFTSWVHAHLVTRGPVLRTQ